MNRLLLAALVVILLAGAFPAEAYHVVGLVSEWLTMVTGMITPKQQAALILIAVLLALLGRK